MSVCDVGSFCADIYVWIALFVIFFVSSFLLCCQRARLIPLICGNEVERIVRGQKGKVAGKPYSAETNATVDIEGSPFSDESDSLPSIPARVSVRCLCTIFFGFFFGVVIIAIITATVNAFPSVPASACKTSCATTDPYCCTYTPADLSYQSVSFSMFDGTRQGTTLNGWWIPGNQSASARNLTLLYHHGSGGNVASNYRIQRYKFLSGEMGLNIFVYDYPGYGLSGGVANEGGVMSAARAALREAQARGGAAGPRELLTLGRSMGSAVALRLAAEVAPTGGFKGVMLQSAFTTYKDAAAAGLPVMGWAAASVWPVTLDGLGAARAAVAGGGGGAPPACLYQYHSQEDEFVPLDMGRRVFDAAAAASNASCTRWVTSPSAKHDDPLTREERDAIRAWLAAVP